MTEAERKAKEQELYGLMELDVMRNSNEVRQVLGNILSQKSNDTSPEDSKAAIDLIFGKIMTNQDLNEDVLKALGVNEDNKDRINMATELVKSYQRGEIDIEQAKQEMGLSAEDNQK